ncbi:trypsin-like peptidase domain-containing protein [Dermacoccaceae bacterium W4C1]
MTGPGAHPPENTGAGTPDPARPDAAGPESPGARVRLPSAGGAQTAPSAAPPTQQPLTPAQPAPHDEPRAPRWRIGSGRSSSGPASGGVAPSGQGSAPAAITAEPSAPTTGGPAAVRRGPLLAAALAIALVAGLAGGVAGAWFANSDERDPAAAQVSDPDTGQVASSVLPGVVTLKIGASGTGSGFVIRQDGYIVTNNHVAAAANGGAITVLFNDGTRADAKLVGRDASYDLAVVKVERSGLKTLSFADSSKVKVGDEVIAVGAPLGLNSTVTTGIVSALNRPVVAGQSQDEQSYMNAIQTDAAINPGNSGGPLVDRRGQIVGVNTAIARVPGSSSASGGSIGLGFAIPSDVAKRAAEEIISTGKVRHPTLGVRTDPTFEGPGAKIVGSGSEPAVEEGSPAAKAGLKEDDVILEVDGQQMSSSTMLTVTIRSHAVGDEVSLLVRSGDAERTVKVTLTAADND